MAETPARSSGSGRMPAERVTGDNWVPNTVISVPGANAWAYDAPLRTAVMTVDCDVPTTNVTGMLMACGMALLDCTVTRPAETPREGPAPFTGIVRGADRFSG